MNFRRLAAALEVVEDEDFEWLEAAASSGVRLGVDQTMPRVPAVFEEKVKWNLDFTDEEFRDTWRAITGLQKKMRRTLSDR